MSTTEFSPNLEVCLASITQPMPTGEMVAGPLHVGHYSFNSEDPVATREIFLEQDGDRIHVFAENIPQLIKQLRRVRALLSE